MRFTFVHYKQYFMDIPVHVSFHPHVRISMGYIIRMEIAGSWGICIIKFIVCYQIAFHKWLH